MNDSMAEKSVPKTYVVGVTGFGLYVPSLNFNASQILLEALPSVVSLPHTSEHVRLVKYPVIPVTYNGVANDVGRIWNTPYQKWATNTTGPDENMPSSSDSGTGDKRNPCLVIHLGQAPNLEGYLLEKFAHRDGYVLKDVEGKLPKALKDRDSDTSVAFAMDRELLQPSLDIEKIAAKVQEKDHTALLRVSSNAGRYLCEYIFYSSLAELAKANEETRKVLFMHVPAKNSKADIQRGKDTFIALVAAALENAEPSQ